MPKIYSYILKGDVGAAPNPFWGVCTLTICKPAIRRTAQTGDWVIGTGSRHTACRDGHEEGLSGRLIYAMKVTDKMTLPDYNSYCRKILRKKIPKWSSRNWKERVGDCIYDYSTGKKPRVRKSVHNHTNIKKDLNGKYALLSDYFYYFGEKPVSVPRYLQRLITNRQGHLRIENRELLSRFLRWISKYKSNKMYAYPKRRFEVEKMDMGKQPFRCTQS